MKKNTVIIAAVALLAAATGAVTSGIVTHLNQNNTTTRVIERVESTPNVYTSVATEQSYPDLTYAAEKAVKAVVSIEVTKKLSSQRNMDPFFFFFGGGLSIRYFSSLTPSDQP